MLEYAVHENKEAPYHKNVKEQHKANSSSKVKTDLKLLFKMKKKILKLSKSLVSQSFFSLSFPESKDQHTPPLTKLLLTENPKPKRTKNPKPKSTDLKKSLP